MENRLPQEILEARKTEYNVHPLILSRWSPRAMTGEPIDRDLLMSLFDAARWAPSSYNAQPWRFIYAHQNTPQWNTLFSLLVPFNQEWARRAGALVLIISYKIFEHTQKVAVTHSFDTGAAWAYFALQGHINQLVVHGMQGFNYRQARKVCQVPEDYQIEAMAAIGKRGKREDLRKDMREKEFPSQRKPLNEITMEGTFHTSSRLRS